MTTITLFKMRVRQEINERFIFGKSGWVVMLFEFNGLLAIIFAMMHGYSYAGDSALLFLIAFHQFTGL